MYREALTTETQGSDRQHRVALRRVLSAALAVLVVAGTLLGISMSRGTAASAKAPHHGATTPSHKVPRPTPSTTPPTVPVSVPPTPVTVPAPPPPPPPPPLLAHGAEGSLSQIPWSEVGAGWTLALWQRVPTWEPKGPASLFLVNPVGGRYLINDSVPGQAYLAGWAAATRIALLQVATAPDSLIALNLENGEILWQRPLAPNYPAPSISGDGQHVLVSEQHFVGNSVSTEMIDIDLATGATLHDFTVQTDAASSYTLPRGLAAILDLGPSLRRVGLDGSTEVKFPSSFSKVGQFNSSFLSTPDGQELVMSGATGVAVVSNSGSLVAQLPLPISGPYTQCDPLRWWSAGVAMVLCTSIPVTYWLVPLSGAAPTQVAAGSGGGMFDLWDVAGTIFGETGGCANTWITRLGSDGKFVDATIPGLTSSNRLLAATATQLEAVDVVAACDGNFHGPAPAAALVLYSPASNSSTVLLGSSVNGGTVLGAEAYPVGGWS